MHMMHWHYLWVSVLLALVAMPLCSLSMPLPPLWGDMQVKHTWNAVPANWETFGHPPAGTTIDIHIALKPHHETALIDALYQVSDPRLPTYGAHLSREQVAELVEPHPDTLALVKSWLEYGGLPSSSSMTHNSGWLTVTGIPVPKANDLLGASYQLYRHIGTNKTILRTVGYALPVALHAHVQTVVPTTYFSSNRTRQQTTRKHSREEAAGKVNATSGALVTVPPAPVEEDKWVLPRLLRWLYRTEGYEPAATDRNMLGIMGFLDDAPRQKDLTKFMTKWRTDAVDATFRVVPVNGGVYDESKPTDEGNMDMQYAETLVFPTPVIFYKVGGGMEWLTTYTPAPGDADFEWLRYMLDEEKIPQTISISYSTDEKLIPPEYTYALCRLYARLGARGTSVLVASGDDGVGKGDCADRYSGKVIFGPTFPASCPWVTSVGGTTSFEPEVAASLSGGGFSLHFPRESYQNDAVSAFFDEPKGSDHVGYYNPGGRGVPDVSAQAIDFGIVVNGEAVEFSGTSCSTPTVAGIISLLNDYLIWQGERPLGWLNPWLYGDGLALGGFNDITSGFNPGCDTEGFPAVAGWDPVTGLGTPDFIRLKMILDIRV